MINLDYSSFNLVFLYNIGYYIYRSLHHVQDIQLRNRLITEVLNNELTNKICNELIKSAHSFDRRIACAIATNHFKAAIILIKFVHSGRAAKLQHIISNLRVKWNSHLSPFSMVKFLKRQKK